MYRAQAKVVRLVHLYQFKFAEDFQNYGEHFFKEIWDIVAQNRMTTGRECERLIQATIRYLGECAQLPNFAEFLKNNLLVMFQVLVLPNISVTQEDIDEYEDEPQAYIRADLEETDNETRKRHCMKFVQALSKRFPNETSNLIRQVINELVAEYEQDKTKNWHKKITLLNLLIASCIGCYTYLHGATDLLTSDEILFGYLEQLVIPELQALGENNA